MATGTPKEIAPAEVGTLAGGQPYMRAGDGPVTILYIPGLMIQPGMPMPTELRSYEEAYRPFHDVATFWTVWRRPHMGPTSIADMAADYAEVIRNTIAPTIESAGTGLGGGDGHRADAGDDGHRAGGGGRIGVIGLSTGGAIAQQLAVDHPDLVSRLVLSLTADRFDDAALALQRKAEALVRRGKWRHLYALLGRALFPERATRSAMLLWLVGPRWLGAPKDPTHVLAELEAEDEHDLGTRLSTISVPTLVQGAELDVLYPPARVRALVAAIPGAAHIEYPSVGHAGPGPALLADAVEFLTGNSVARMQPE